MRTGRRIVLLLLLLFSLTNIATAKQSKYLTPEELMARLKEGKPVYTELQAQTYVKELIPLVEQAAGRKFKTTPKVKLVRRDAMESVLAHELAIPYKKLCPNLSSAELNEQLDALSYVYSIFILGKYGTITRTLYLLPRNFQPLMEITDVAPKYRQQIAKLVIAHELSHALQDQYMSLADLQKSPDSIEKSLSLAATIEGFAMFIADKVADELKVNSAAKEMARIIATGSIKGVDPAINAASQREAGILQGIYIQGSKFIAYQSEDGGLEKVWKVIATPPTRTSEIYHPETYSLSPKSTIDYAKVLKGMEKHLGKQSWSVENSEVGEMEMHAAYSDMEDKTKEAIFNNLEHTQKLTAKSGNAEVRISFIILKDPAIAPMLISGVQKASKISFDRMKDSSTFKITALPPAKFAEMRNDADITMRIAHVIKGHGHYYPFAFVQAARGRVIVNVDTRGCCIPGTKIANIMDEIFNRLSTQNQKLLTN